MKNTFILTTFFVVLFVNVKCQQPDQISNGCATVTAPYFNYYASGGGHYSFLDISANRTAGQLNQITGMQVYEWWYSNNGGPTYYFGAYMAADHTFPAGNNHICEKYTDYLIDGTVCTYGPFCVDVNVPGACPTINYNITSSYSSNGATYTFSDASSGVPSNPVYTWTVDGASAGSGFQINHTFTTSGTHVVCETISAGGCIYGPFCYNITVQLCKGYPDFTVTGNAPTYTFTNTSTGMSNPVFQWVFDGSNSCGTPSCQHIFSNGHHNFCLFITDGNCKYSACNTYDQGGCPAVNPAFNYSSNDNITYDFVNATTGTDASVTYSWTIDGNPISTTLDHTSNTYSTLGYHNVCLTVHDYGCNYTACADSLLACTLPEGGMSFNETHSPILLIADSLANNLPIISHSWSINGVLFSHDSVFSHTFVSGDTYTICDTFVLANGCSYINCEQHTIPQASTDIPSLNPSIPVWLFPNPSYNGTVTLKNQSQTSGYIEVYNYMGEKVFEKPLPRTEIITLELTFLPAGAYVFRIVTEQGNTNIRWFNSSCKY